MKFINTLKQTFMNNELKTKAYLVYTLLNSQSILGTHDAVFKWGTTKVCFTLFISFSKVCYIFFSLSFYWKGQ